VRGRFASLGLALLLASTFGPARPQADERISSTSLGIIPLPRSVAAYAATYAVPTHIWIAAASPDERNVASFAADFLRGRGISAGVASQEAVSVLRLTSAAHDPSLGREGYRLRVGRAGIVIAANSGAGLYYGLQTLEQLFAPGGGNAIHFVDISDAPAYPYRGIHLDVGRHFFPVWFVEKYIDLAARYKLNMFHWHLTEDQGWRIQIKKYPRLTTVAACRSGTMIGQDSNSNDRVRYCGFYTQAQIRNVVAYAKQRYVTIVPEIEMPGHSIEVLAAYPQLACAPGDYRVRTTWGVSDDIVCPSERTIHFYEDVLAEVMALFPGPYVHTGGDEAPKAVWKRSQLVRELERRYHLKDEDAVQGWFDTRIESFLHAHGRRMIGWDEILGGNISRSAIVMSWRGISGGVVAATRGNDVIMTPDGPLYLDAGQGDPAFEPLNIGSLTTLREVYDYDPGIDALPANSKKHILGAQANLWTEYIATPAYAEYMLLPRMLALAELVWTPIERKDWDSFVARTGNQYARLEAEGVQFRIPEPTGLQDTVSDVGGLKVTLRSPVPGATMFYTTDGSLPTQSSKRYDNAFALDLEPGQAIVVRVITVLRSGRVSVPARALYERRATTATVP
jgi:hexosaminidase